MQSSTVSSASPQISRARHPQPSGPETSRSAAAGGFALPQRLPKVIPGAERTAAASTFDADAGFERIRGRLIDRLPGAVIVVDHEGAVVLENQAARQFVSLNPGLQRRAGRLWMPGAHRYLDSPFLLGHARLARAAPPDRQSVRTVTLRLPDAEDVGPVFIEARGLGPGDSPTRTRAGDFWLLTLYSPASRTSPSARALQQLLGLTPAESLLVQALFAGQGLSRAAATLGISRETAKTQLSRTFRKCRVQSQAQLTRLVAAGPFFAAPGDDASQPGRSWPLPRTTYL